MRLTERITEAVRTEIVAEGGGGTGGGLTEPERTGGGAGDTSPLLGRENAGAR